MRRVLSLPRSHCTCHSPLRLRGMNLIEIMVVITIIGLMSAAVAVYAVGAKERAQLDVASNQVSELVKSFDIYNLQNGAYPSSALGPAALSSGPPTRRIVPRWPDDPWGHPYRYAFPAQRAELSFDVWSAGPDGVDGNDDDIGNW